MSVDRITIDTNILIYSVDKSAGYRHDIAVSIIEQAVRVSTCLTLQAVSEFYAVVSRKAVLPRPVAAQAARMWMDMFPIVCASAEAASQALDDVAVGRASYWDALMVATAAEAACQAILTEDMADGSVLNGVRVINPFGGGRLSEAARILLMPATTGVA